MPGGLRRHMDTALLGVSFIPWQVMLNRLTCKGATAKFKYSLEENIGLQNTSCLPWQAPNLGPGRAAQLLGK